MCIWGKRIDEVVVVVVVRRECECAMIAPSLCCSISEIRVAIDCPVKLNNSTR